MSDGSIKIDTKIDDSGLKSALADLKSSLDSAAKYFDTLGPAGKQTFQAIESQLKKVDAAADITGDRIGALAEKKKILNAEIQKLIASGLKPEDLQIRSLKNVYDNLTNAEIANANAGKLVKKSLGDSFASMRDIMQGPIAAIQMVTQAIKGIGAATVGQSAKIEDMVAAFTPMVGGAENAKEMIAALNREAATTPFELEGIGSVAKQLLPALGNDVGKVTETFRMLGDTAGGNIQKLDSITRGYMKSILKGKVDMESLNMISESGVPIYTELAKSLGVSTAKMMDMSSKGQITGDMLTQAFKNMTSEGGIFFNGMNVASQTLNGKLSTLSDNVKQAGGAIGDAFLPMTKAMVDGINAVLGGFVSWAANSKILKDILPPLIIGLTAGIVALGIAALATSGFFTAMGAALAGATGGLSLVIAAVIAGIVFVATHWNQTVLFFEETIANIAMWFSVAWAVIKEGAIVAFNAEKIAALSLAKIIIDNVLGSVAKLLDVMGKMPFVGEQFKAASSAVKGFQGKLDGAIDSAKAESAAAIKAADDTRKTEQQAAKDKLALAKKSFAERQALIDAEDKKPEPDKPNPDTQPPATDTTLTDAELKTRNEWLEKAKQAYIDNLEEEEDAALDAAKRRNATVAEQVAIAQEYDDKEYAAYKEMLDEKEAADLKDVKDGETIAEIKQSYERDLTEYKKKQAEERTKIEEDAAQAELDLKKKASEEQIKLDEEADKKNFWKSSGIVGTQKETVNADTGAIEKGPVEGGTELGNLATGMMSFTDVLSGGLQSVLTAVTSLSSVSQLLNPISTMVDSMMDVLGPLIDNLLNPLVGALKILGKTVGNILAPALEILQPVIEIISAIFVALYNNIILPIGNVIIGIFNAVISAINWVIGIINSALGWLGVHINTLDTAATLTAIDTESLSDAAEDTTDYAGALEDANDELKKNRNLFTKASKAADAYDAVLTSVISTVSSFYASLTDVGSDLASTIIDSLLDGFDNDDFLYALEEYITEAVVQAAVFTDSFTAEIAKIGTALATAIATGDTDAIASLKDQLSSLYTSAAATANAATEAVSAAFGSYAVGTLGLPSDGPIYAHAGEAVIPAGLMSEAASAGLTIAPTASLLSGTSSLSLSQSFQLVVDGKAMAATVYKYQDELVGAAYGA